MALEHFNQASERAAKSQPVERSNIETAHTKAAESVLRSERHQLKGDDRLQTLLKTPQQESRKAQSKELNIKSGLEANRLITERGRHNVPHVGFIARQLQRSEFRRTRALKPDRQNARYKEHKPVGETREHELQEQIAIRAANQKLLNQTEQNATIKQRQQNDPFAASLAEEKEALPGLAKERQEGAATESPVVASDKSGFNPEGLLRTAGSGVIDIQAGINVQTEPQQTLSPAEGVKLEEIVGPEATLTFREKLREVWGILEEGSTGDLDVIARMPVNLMGASAVELLVVESPQGVYFVAFLRNKNDFDLLEPFDRHALLPPNPSRYLIEAAIIAYEQLDAIVRGGCEKIGEGVSQLAASRSSDDPALVFLRQRWLFAKRRRRRFERIIDYLVGELDEYDLREESNKAGLAGAEKLESLKDGLGEEEQEDSARVVKLADHLGGQGRLKKVL